MIYKLTIIAILIACVIFMLLFLSKKDKKGFAIVCCIIGGIGVTCAIIGHYGTVGFHWDWFLFFELPLYLFLGWAVYYGIYKPMKHLLK